MDIHSTKSGQERRRVLFDSCDGHKPSGTSATTTRWRLDLLLAALALSSLLIAVSIPTPDVRSPGQPTIVHVKISPAITTTLRYVLTRQKSSQHGTSTRNR